MTLSELLTADEILSSKVTGDPEVAGVTQSSAAVLPGSVFFAVAGHRADGHKFAEGALAKGAAAVVVEREEVHQALDRSILVPSTRRQLGLTAARWYGRPTEKFRLVGITGTNGKTTTAYLLRELWEKSGLVSGMIGTVQYLVGNEALSSDLTTPDALALQQLFHRMAGADVTHAAMEVSSIALDQSRTEGCAFDTAVFTNLTQDHLDYHHSMEEYYQAKLRLFREYPLQTAVINQDDPYGARLMTETTAPRKLGFSLSRADAAFYLHSERFHKSGTKARLHTPEGELDLEIGLIGRHNLYNVAGALAAAHALGMDLPAAAALMRTARGAPGRLERVMDGENYPHIFVDYAHTDDALRNLLSAVRDLRGKEPGRIITVFGCGGDRDRTKRPKMGNAASTLSDVTIATSDNPRTEDPDKIVDDIEAGIVRGKTEYHRVVNRREAIRFALSLAVPEDIVVIAGKGHETYQIVGAEKFPFDDREVVREYYRP
jgi:UDP-N-acetylmuramoyl-L-alanyl-D-glutamate--2,6-diaminopimelate ligase